jgi:cell division protease FtsH
MVTIYGLNDKIGNVTYYDSTGQSEYNFLNPEETAKSLILKFHFN